MLYQQEFRSLALRREMLVARTQEQRMALGQQLDRFGPSLAWGERGWRAWLFVRAHPWLVVSPLIVVAVIRPRVVIWVVARSLVVWRATRSVGALLQQAR